MLRDSRILNPRLLAILAGAGHGDLIVIADAGLPVPPGVDLLDLSLVPGVPGFLEVVEVVTRSMVVQSALIAGESRAQPHFPGLAAALGQVPIADMTHEEFKGRTAAARVVIRTGECTPYANVGLVAGVSF
ncbi:MAG: D-ribose pyranase [Candidatus Dormibacter sp.]